MSISLPGFNYTMLYLGKVAIDNKQLYIESLGILSFRLKMGNTTMEQDLMTPVNSMATFGIQFSLNSIEELLGKIRSIEKMSKNEYPIIFVYNRDYDNSGDDKKTTSKKGKSTRDYDNSEGGRIRYIGGIFLDDREDQNQEKQNKTKTSRPYYLLGSSLYRNTSIIINSGNNEDNKNKRARVYFNFVTDFDDKIFKNINKIMINITISSSKVEKIEIDNPTFWIIKNPNTYLRTFPWFEEEKLISNNVPISSADIELIYLGSQITGKAEYLSKPKKEAYYIFPIVIPYIVRLPRSISDIPLPKDNIFSTFMLTLDFSDAINRSNFVEKLKNLTDWLTDKHKEVLIKILINGKILETIISLIDPQYLKIIRDKYYNILLESNIITSLYKYKLNFTSPFLLKIVKVYENMNLTRINNFEDFINEFLLSTLSLNIKVKEKADIDNLKLAVGIFALAYGLHGISHLIMKVLGKLSGIYSYGERIIIKLPNSTVRLLNSMISSSQKFINKNEILENTFEFKEGSIFSSKITVFSEEPYTYSYFSNILTTNGNINLDLIKRELVSLLSKNGDDACEENWKLERKILRASRIMYNSLYGKTFDEVDNFIRDNYVDGDTMTSKKILAPRDIFRYWYGNIIRKKLEDHLKQQSIQIDKSVLENIIQYIIPYHVPQCVDGCYNCVLTERSLKSNMCDLSPVSQELKTSKWVALCILKQAGWIDFNWIDCNL